MKNILLITELYPVPSKDNMASGVCHFFCKEWVAAGMNVIAIHFQPVHSWLWYILVRLFNKQLRNRLGGLYYRNPIKETQHYLMDGVSVYRVPIYHFIPKGRYKQKELKLFYEAVHKILSSNHFIPDVITGHMLPIEIIPDLNKKYNAKTCNVSHGVSPKLKARYSDIESIISSYSGWGFRSETIKKEFETLITQPQKSFICYSGIPEKLVSRHIERSYESCNKIIYVGELIERKYPYELLQAVHKYFNSIDFSLTYVGDGPERPRLEKYIKNNNLESKVKLLGRIPREEITKYLDKSDVFAMISRGEAFGLVYLEAMARGCITIASRNEGIDGIIVNEVNGYLVESGNVEETVTVLNAICNLTAAQRKTISMAGYETASNMTDKNMALDYLHKLQSL